MITHIVMWSFKNEASEDIKQQNIQKFADMLNALPACIQEIKYFEVGVKNSSSPQDSMDVVLISKFSSWSDLKAYAIHPEHQKVVAFAKEVVQERAVTDYES